MVLIVSLCFMVLIVWATHPRRLIYIHQVPAPSGGRGPPPVQLLRAAPPAKGHDKSGGDRAALAIVPAAQLMSVPEWMV